MSIPDFIPGDVVSPFSAAGFQDWIPPSKEEEARIEQLKAEEVKPEKKKALPISELQREDLTDEDLRDIGIDPARYKRMSEDFEDEALAKLAKEVD